MTESNPSPEDPAELALRKALEKTEFAYRDAMPLDRPAALAEFERTLAAFADFMRNREDSGAEMPTPRDQQ